MRGPLDPIHTSAPPDVDDTRNATELAIQAARESLRATRWCLDHSRRCLENAREALARVYERARRFDGTEF